MHERVYHANSLDLMIWFDPAGISALDHCHGNADEKEHLPLLHATTEEDKVNQNGILSQGLATLSFNLCPLSPHYGCDII